MFKPEIWNPIGGALSRREILRTLCGQVGIWGCTNWLGRQLSGGEPAAKPKRALGWYSPSALCAGTPAEALTSSALPKTPSGPGLVLAKLLKAI